MVTVRPMAKVNLTLEVIGRRGDGYHELRSIFLRIGLSDRLSVTAAGSEDTLTISGLPCAIEGNLVLRAFELLRRSLDAPLPALAAQLDKRIPIGAGLGGGSSDAAAALDVAAAAWGIGLSADERSGLALRLGSDVPFFAAGVPAALVEGRGEKVSEVPTVRGGAGVLLALSSTSLSTANVFAHFDELDMASPTGTTDKLERALREGMDGSQLADATKYLADGNHLWLAAAAIAPDLVGRRAALEWATGRRWLLSGSGPTLFAVFGSHDDATAAGQALATERAIAASGVMLCAVDLDDPDKAWRHAWPTDH